ncbi:hypothetical protein [Haloferax sp. ATB1]|uniref:hypothetical protein n=1 Tax=Haloferax sp. ATB1 TaxID=1508454 RepID=UPI0005B1F1FA|nr:hypothetical protein [Haloferax sp. ATB1]
MTTAADAREAAGRYAEEFINADDPHGTHAEELCSDEVFGELAVALKNIDIQLQYSDDLSQVTERRMEESAEQIRMAMVSRATSILPWGDD